MASNGRFACAVLSSALLLAAAEPVKNAVETVNKLRGLFGR